MHCCKAEIHGASTTCPPLSVAAVLQHNLFHAIVDLHVYQKICVCTTCQCLLEAVTVAMQNDVPPRDLQVKVHVIRELGEVMLSVGPTFLTKGSVHSLPRHEVERFLRSGDLQALDLIRE